MMMINMGNGRFVRPEEIAATEITAKPDNRIWLELVMKSGERIEIMNQPPGEEAMKTLTRVAHSIALMCANVCRLEMIE